MHSPRTTLGPSWLVSPSTQRLPPTVQCFSVVARSAPSTLPEGPTPSRLCLGTMQFGEAIAAPEAHRLLSVAHDAGINFVDSAEMYPVPQRAETQGASERILGQWLATQRREDILVSSKVTGPSGQMTWIRQGPRDLSRQAIAAAIDGSLQRLGVDYLDVVHLHWPDRGVLFLLPVKARYVPMFGDARYEVERRVSSVPLEEQARALGDAITAGKVRRWGLSNETAWGLMRFCELARTLEGVDRPAFLQNAYSLLCRGFEEHLAECCLEEGVGLLAYSPLAMGLLTGKYLVGGGPPEARLNKYRGRYAEAEQRYASRPGTGPAVTAYARLAARAGMRPTELALRFALSHPAVASLVCGVTSEGQLREQVDAAAKGPLPPDLLAEVDAIHAEHPNPNP